VPATLRLTREAFGMELRRGRFGISVDGKDAGSIEWRQTVEVPVEPGSHALQIRAGRYSSPVRSFDADDGDVINFRSHGAMLWPRWLASFAVPGLAISLERE
jgi:hypothetical protein